MASSTPDLQCRTYYLNLGLFNRRQFNVAANKLLKNTQHTLCIAIIDIDHFKRVNDSYGHAVGDKVIIKAADILRVKSRNQDVLARYGGEEFIVLMPNTLLSDAHEKIEAIRLELENVKIEAGQSSILSITISAGITEIPPEEISLHEAINRADKALYEAKNNGRNQSRLYKNIKKMPV